MIRNETKVIRILKVTSYSYLIIDMSKSDDKVLWYKWHLTDSLFSVESTSRLWEHYNLKNWIDAYPTFDAPTPFQSFLKMAGIDEEQLIGIDVTIHPRELGVATVLANIQTIVGGEYNVVFSNEDITTLTYPYDALKRWQRADNYIGETYEDMLVVIGQHRDSHLIDEWNYQAVSEALESYAESVGESGVLQAHSANHWAVGWVESLKAFPGTATARQADGIMNDLITNYPLYDEDGYCQFEHDKLQDMIESNYPSFVRDLADYLGFDDVEDMEALYTSDDIQTIIYRSVDESVSYYGYEEAWFTGEFLQLNSYFFSDLHAQIESATWIDIQKRLVAKAIREEQP